MDKLALNVRKSPFGYWVISAIVNGYGEERQYSGYTRKEAIQKFIQEFSN